MNVEILHQPDSAIAHIQFAPREELIAEAGAMVAMSSEIKVTTTLRRGKGGGMLGGLKRMLAGESLFLSVFRSGEHAAEVYLAPRLLGDILPYQMLHGGLIVQSTGYMASTPGVDIELGWQGFKSFLSGESIFWLDLTGDGVVLLSAFGGIYEIEVEGEYIVDTGHILAFEKSLKFSITKPTGSSWLSTFVGGEGFVCRFTGKGRLFCQTHNAGAFGRLVGGQLPPR